MNCGEYYNISCCMSYPINIGAIEKILVRLLRSYEFIEAECYKVNVKDFKFDDAMDNVYEVIIIKNEFIPNIMNNTLIDLKIRMINGIESRIFIEYFDDEFYSINLMTNYEQIIENMDSQRILKEINEISLDFWNILYPLYGKVGVEQGVVSIKVITNSDCEKFYENFFIMNGIHEMLDVRVKKVIKERSDIIRLNNGGLFISDLKIPKNEKNKISKMIIKAIKSYKESINT